MDIVLGAIFFLAYLEEYFKVAISLHVYFALAAAIWLIYTADHLIDARCVQASFTGRHAFHRRNSKLLIILGAMVLCFSLVNIYFLDGVIIRNGALLAAGCVVYLLAVYLMPRLWIKELLVAIGYAVGVFLAPVSLSAERLEMTPVVQFAGIALLNLLIFSYYDQQVDQQSGFRSLVLRIGPTRSKWFIVALALVLICSSCLLWLTYGSELQALFLVMAGVLLMVFCFPRHFQKAERYRTIGDGIFYLPALLLL